MRTLNIIIIIVLILATGYIFHLSNFNKHRIKHLEEQIATKEAVIKELQNENDNISANIVILKDSVQSFKTSIEVYNDSIIKIKDSYEATSKNVYTLSDSASFEFFKKYVEDYAARHGLNTNRIH